MFKNFISKMLDGFIYGLGFVLFSAFFVSIGLLFTGTVTSYQVKNVLINKGILPDQPGVIESEIPTTVLKHFTSPRIPVPKDYQHRTVSTSKEFFQALREAQENNGKYVITLKAGEYKITKQLHIRTPHIYIRSESGNPYDVTIRGPGMHVYGKDIGNIFRVTGDYFYLDGITLADVRNHLIQIAGESNASYPYVNNCILQDAYEQLIKVSYNKNSPENISVGGIIENSVFQYTREIAPNYYTGGIDALGSVDWQVKNNVFRDIASPKGHIAQHAVHFWVNSSGTQVINNLFVDVDRAIGFGMPLHRNTRVLTHSHLGGLIKDNVIFHSDNGDPFGDTGIILESAQDAVVENNFIQMEHDYPRAIEYRFDNTKDIFIRNNQTNKAISSRNGGQAVLENNNEDIAKFDFIQRIGAIQKNLNIIELYDPIIAKKTN